MYISKCVCVPVCARADDDEDAWLWCLHTLCTHLSYSRVFIYKDLKHGQKHQTTHYLIDSK